MENLTKNQVTLASDSGASQENAAILGTAESP